MNYSNTSPFLAPPTSQVGLLTPVYLVGPHTVPPLLRSWRTSPITATVLTKNSQRRIAEVLTALNWCDEVVVLDSGSEDETLRIAQQFSNVSLHRLEGEFPGFGRMHQMATELASNDWILSIDSDEVVSDELVREILETELDPETVYLLPFHNYFQDRLITTCGWSGEYHGRLYNRRVTGFSQSRVHEKVEDKGLEVRKFRHPVRHYSYESLDDFLRKMQAYTTLFAEQNRGRKSAGTFSAWSHGAWAFFKSYILQRGIIQGYAGFVISAYGAHTAVWKYLKLAEANRTIPG